MSWAKIDDRFYDHPKVVAAGPLGAALFVAGLCYSAGHLTDGFLPAAVVPRLINLAGIKQNGHVVTIEYLVDTLVIVRLWERTRNGFQIHDYHDYNPSGASVKEERAKTRERVQNHRKQRNSNGQFVAPPEEPAAESNAVTTPVTPTVTNTSPVPVPVPVPVPIPNPVETRGVWAGPATNPFPPGVPAESGWTKLGNVQQTQPASGTRTPPPSPPQEEITAEDVLTPENIAWWKESVFRAAQQANLDPERMRREIDVELQTMLWEEAPTPPAGTRRSWRGWMKQAIRFYIDDLVRRGE